VDTFLLGGVLGVLLLVLLAGGLWVAGALLAVAVTAILIATGVPPGTVAATTIWSAINSWNLTALPMFIWMGEILFRSRLSNDMFEGLSVWLNRLPGRLLHTNILGCAIFAAVSGSSAATTATIGRISLPELRARGYDERMAIGTLAGSGTFGFLIPPSIIMIVYGAATEQSIARLFIAGIGPGLMLCGMLMSYVVIWSLLHPERLPAPDMTRGFADKLRRTLRLLPVVLLIVGVIGSIYAGFASPTEAAAIGVALSLLLSKLMGSLTKDTFSLSLAAAARTSAMITLILVGASVLTVAMGYTGIPRELAAWITEQQLSPYALLAALTLFFIVLGFFLDGISIVVLTTSIILPMVDAAGLDLIWFGIFLVIVVEISQITPPVGFNLFVLQGLTGHNIFTLAFYALPFFCLLVAAVVLLVVFPEIALWLPRTMTRN